MSAVTAMVQTPRGSGGAGTRYKSVCGQGCLTVFTQFCIIHSPWSRSSVLGQVKQVQSSPCLHGVCILIFLSQIEMGSVKMNVSCLI